MSLARKIGALFGAGGSALTTSSASGGQARPNLQPTLVVNYVIKTCPQMVVTQEFHHG